ncbi:hypothetical protein BJF78_07870 [Pseudonocardia sp. CNS-139]|nr:hypothetical protein BJF78_07870 [Pseudonocardia sp. CNS-139]
MVAASHGGPAGDGPGEPAKDVNGASGPAQEPTPTAEEEPPEEPRDAAAAAVVAGLESEVLVVDEQPRYHVVGCRALIGKALIPIPVREAVELGFTPCGWCTPDRTLAAQHASVR